MSCVVLKVVCRNMLQAHISCIVISLQHFSSWRIKEKNERQHNSMVPSYNLFYYCTSKEPFADFEGKTLEDCDLKDYFVFL